MPRAARKKSSSNIYHVMLRGIDRQVIFQDDEDCEKFLQSLEECERVSQFILHAYCLMGNHLHLLIEEAQEPLELVFKRLGVRYVYWYNWKYKRTGHLFQDRFKSEPVEDDAYFLTVLRYIYQNPVKAGLCQNAKDYPWSSYQNFPTKSGFVSNNKVLQLLPLDEFYSFVEMASEDKFLDMEEQARLNDREAASLIRLLCGVASPTDFCRLSVDEQVRHIHLLQEKHCSIRQLARLLGMSKGLIEKRLKS